MAEEAKLAMLNQFLENVVRWIFGSDAMIMTREQRNAMTDDAVRQEATRIKRDAEVQATNAAQQAAAQALCAVEQAAQLVGLDDFCLDNLRQGVAAVVTQGEEAVGEKQAAIARLNQELAAEQRRLTEHQELLESLG